MPQRSQSKSGLAGDRSHMVSLPSSPPVASQGCMGLNAIDGNALGVTASRGTGREFAEVRRRPAVLQRPDTDMKRGRFMLRPTSGDLPCVARMRAERDRIRIPAVAGRTRRHSSWRLPVAWIETAAGAPATPFSATATRLPSPLIIFSSECDPRAERETELTPPSRAASKSFRVAGRSRKVRDWAKSISARA